MTEILSADCLSSFTVLKKKQSVIDFYTYES